ncbi:tyrosine-protein kinase [Rahnella aquatilis CIP 78.65 = ATCC 33071]|uniref:Capsular exopolysaccharide biosynthesis protein n=1 Tax=Rahnella aquatilis (strain ATCC 33071 / DSM 4594 / JCM 1683 / NBRC 105701 / NCIMB 13365 / CIP 78.65) TaxID=745277 RepID=H2IPD4_RAHAC|nr:polysaccharide biosynthesis tyrosine autokinase [Rahnella aquatilis]AEX53442.1 capsular exopolysaccharide biosynthesis protein [Rahnella aquatilis CIP 78.65 = ATCC 33071]KFD03555.1 tyrosine-protein kinase [Rahnella aquatilis CIP 78.65 = ATCC 33071]
MIEKITGQSGNKNIPDEFDLRKNMGAIIDKRYIIIVITFIFVFIGLLYAFLSSPVYHADALVQVDPSGEIDMMSNISQLLPAKSPVSATEMQLITSRAILGETVTQLNLDTEVRFTSFPIIGEAIRRYSQPGVPRISVDIFEPRGGVIGDSYTLEILSNAEYQITSPSGATVSGMAGKILDTPEFRIEVNEINALKGDKFSVTKVEVLKVIEELRANVNVIDQGKDTGILTISYNGRDRKQIKNILQTIIDCYALQSIHRKAEEAEKSLGFIKSQLPLVKNNLGIAETKLNAFRSRNNSVDLPMEAKSTLDSMVQLDGQINQLILKETEISKLYTTQHPAYLALIEKIQVLKDEKKNLNEKVSTLPLMQQEVVRLTRDVQSGQLIYMQLLNKQQELKISQASTIGSVRIIDRAVTGLKPVKPNKALAIFIFACLGLISSVGFILAKVSLQQGIDSAEILEDIGLNVVSNVPLSEWRNNHYSNSMRDTRPVSLLALEKTSDIAIEALRNLRTSLYFSMMEAGSNVLMISGATPEVGKTFISSNLAVVVSQGEKRVLYIDCDMRKGYAHRIFDIKNVGLTEAITGSITYQEAVQSTKIPRLDIITRGKLSKNPSELLLRKQYHDLIHWASDNYDFVILDAPPALAVSDAVIIGRYAGISMLVAKFEQSTVREIESAIRVFNRNNIDINGVILNAVVNKPSGFYNYGKKEIYEYHSPET